MRSVPDKPGTLRFLHLGDRGREVFVTSDDPLALPYDEWLKRKQDAESRETDAAPPELEGWDDEEEPL